MHAQQDWESSHPDDQYEKPKYGRSSCVTYSPLQDHKSLSRNPKFYSVVIVPLCTWWVAARKLSTNMTFHKFHEFHKFVIFTRRKQCHFDNNVKSPYSLSRYNFPAFIATLQRRFLLEHRCAALTAAAPSISEGMLRIAGSHKRWMALSICANLTLLLLLIFKAAPQAQPHRWAVQPPSPADSIYHYRSSYTHQSYRIFEDEIDPQH